MAGGIGHDRAWLFPDGDGFQCCYRKSGRYEQAGEKNYDNGANLRSERATHLCIPQWRPTDYPKTSVKAAVVLTISSGESFVGAGLQAKVTGAHSRMQNKPSESLAQFSSAKLS